MTTYFFKRVCQAGLSVALAVMLAGCELADDQQLAASADLLLSNGIVYTGDAAQPWADTIAISGKTLLYVGNRAGAQQYVGPATEQVDLGGKLAMAGLIDGHVHPVLGGMELASQCLFPTSAGPADIEAVLRACMAVAEPHSWIVGGRWDSQFFARNAIGSPKQWLDRFTGDYPVVLADDTGHNRWVNSAAMARAGLDATIQFEGGRVVLDDRGKPSGLLLETAMYPVLAAVAAEREPTGGQYLAAARLSVKRANAFGITGFNEAGDADQGVVAYHALDRAGELTTHVEACIAVAFDPDGAIDVAWLQQLRDNHRSANLKTGCAKLFLDGVPSEARTAAVLEDYTPDPRGHVHRGSLLIPPEQLRDHIVVLEQLGMTVKIHVAGDRAVREAINAIEYARQQNGPLGLRHELAHSGFIAADDMARMAALNIVADMSPSIWYPSPITDSIIAAMGERGRHYWPFKDLLDAGVEVVAGTDWPAVVPDMNPWPGIEAMVTRRNPDGSRTDSLWPEQAISLQQAIQIYTVNGAKTLDLEDVTGTLVAGKLADVIILSQNIFAINPDQIGDTLIEKTFFQGQLVYQRTR